MNNKSMKLNREKVALDPELATMSLDTYYQKYVKKPDVKSKANSKSHRPAPQRPAPQRPAPQRPAPQRPAPQRPASQRPAPDRPAPDRPAPQRPAPHRPAPHASPSEAQLHFQRTHYFGPAYRRNQPNPKSSDIHRRLKNLSNFIEGTKNMVDFKIVVQLVDKQVQSHKSLEKLTSKPPTSHPPPPPAQPAPSTAVGELTDDLDTLILNSP